MRRLILASAVCALFATSCTSWRTVEQYEGWTLYSQSSEDVDAVAFARAFEPAHAVVEDVFGPFEQRVRVHAWRSEGDEPLGAGEAGLVQEIPGIGRARVRAYHARGDGLFSSRSGIYAGMADAGTAVHELIHARLAESHPDLPLWFEEGLACVIGDGFLDGDEWRIDGLSCWPLRELRDQRLTDEELARVLSLRAEDGTDSRENVLAHFVGWAIVFDLYRESGSLDWRAWMERCGRRIPLAEARVRLDRTLDEATERAWLERLSDEDRAVRMATAKGLWKLRSERAVVAMLDQLDREEDPEVQAALSINILAAAGEREMPRRLNGRLWRLVWPVLKRVELPDADEERALRQLFTSFRWRGRSDSSSALETLRRFWAE